MIVLAGVLLCIAGGAGRAVAQDNEPTISLHTAARAGDLGQLKAHIANRVNLDQQDPLGFTAIYCAVSAVRLEAAQLLLDSGANPNGAGPNGLTPLMLAAFMGRKDLVDLLIAKRALIEVRDRQQRTPLHLAVYSGRRDVVKALVDAGADVNGGGRGQTPLSLAMQTNQTAIADYLRGKGGQETQLTPYGGEAAYEQAMPTPQEATTYRAPAAPGAVQLDPNVVAEQMKQYEGLAPALAAVDANSSTEQRAWTMRRLDNRSSMLGAVEKQFGLEMTFVKEIATEEKAEQTIQAIDDLTATRKERYEAIGDALREQRREMLQQSRMSRTGYGSRGRASRTAGATGGTAGATGYGNYAQQGPTVLPGSPEPNEPQVDQETQSQVQAWVSANPGDKQSLLTATHNLDVAELSALQQVAMEEQAGKTAVAIAALMMVREQRITKIILKWQEDDERAARMQQRLGTQGTQDPMAGRRGRRR